MRRLHTDIVVELGVIATRKNPDRLVSRPEETKIPSNLVLINSLRFYIKRERRTHQETAPPLGRRRLRINIRNR